MGDDSSFADGSASDEDDTRPLRLCPDAGCWGLEVMRCLYWGPAANWDGGMALAELVGCSVRDKQGGSSPPAEGQGSDGRGMAGKQSTAACDGGTVERSADGGFHDTYGDVTPKSTVSVTFASGQVGTST
ncbi:hypothetical protein JX266_011556 [Neoarthrinium moseri]|nr:hypothetical protein JX266_011556 [Neoarthrinium moseri]